jgi:hypothetical protein
VIAWFSGVLTPGLWNPPDRQICCREKSSALVPDRYPLPRVEQIVEVRYLYCHTGPEGKLIQAKYFGKVRDDVALADCCVSQLKVKAGDSEPTES